MVHLKERVVISVSHSFLWIRKSGLDCELCFYQRPEYYHHSLLLLETKKETEGGRESDISYNIFSGYGTNGRESAC